MIGLTNFLLYGVGYVYVWGEAVHGRIVIDEGTKHYFLHLGQEVSRMVFLYSGVHSISIWPTVMAVMLAMLTLAKDRITASMHSAVVRRQVLMTVFAIIIMLVTGLLTYDYSHTFVRQFREPEIKSPQTRPAAEGRGGSNSRRGASRREASGV